MKVIQLIQIDSNLVALCDDGSMWAFTDRLWASTGDRATTEQPRWVRLPDIPATSPAG